MAPARRRSPWTKPTLATEQRIGHFAPPPSAVDEKLKTVDPDKFSPKEALELLYELKKITKNE